MTTQADEELEQQIRWALLTWQSAKGPKAIAKAYREFNRLVAMRSPDAVEKLEREKGLR